MHFGALSGTISASGVAARAVEDAARALPLGGAALGGRRALGDANGPRDMLGRLKLTVDALVRGHYLGTPEIVRALMPGTRLMARPPTHPPAGLARHRRPARQPLPAPTLPPAETLPAPILPPSR